MNRSVTRLNRVRSVWTDILMAGMLIVCLFGMTVSSGYTQETAPTKTGKVTGRLFDAETGEALLGATVMIEGTKMGAVTDLQGNFVVRNVPVGSYTVVASMVGYAGVRVTSVVVSETEAAKVELALKPQLVQTQGVTVEAKMLKNTEASLLRERKASHSVSDAISSEAISRSGASDAASAMMRVTGASVANGKYAVVRGLSDRYTNTQLNGSSLPSADPDKQAFNMDLVPTNLLDNIVVTKSYSADKPGNFTGGSINLVTKDFPDARTLSFSAGSSYNTEFTGKDVLTNSTSSRDWLGYDDGMREIPQYLEDNLYRLMADSTSKYRRKPSAANHYDSSGVRYATFMDSACKVFAPQFNPRKRTAPLNQNYSVSYGDNLSFFGRSLGFVGNLTYDRSQSAFYNGNNNLYTALSSTELLEIDRLTENRGSDEVLWGGMASANYSLATNHRIGVRYVYNRNGNQETSTLNGVWNDYGPGQMFASNNVQYTQRTMRSLQVNGSHEMKLGLPVRVEWSYSDAKSKQNENLRQFLYSFNIDSSVVPADTGGWGISSSSEPTVYWRDIIETNKEFNLDLKVSMAKGASLKLGGNYLDKVRTFRQTEIKWAQSASTSKLTEYRGNMDLWIQHAGMTDSSSSLYLFDTYLYFFPTAEDEYDGSQKIPAWYGLLELHPIKKLEMIAGVRHERTDMKAINLSADPFGGKINTSDWLPSVNLTYNLAEKMNLRGAYSRTLARPNIREIAPFRSTEFAGSKYFYGNPELKMTHITNWDLRWEWFMRTNEILAVSAFYKTFVDPIEVSYFGSNYDRKPTNSPTAKNIGLEFEARKNLDQISHKLADFSIGANLTLVRSRLKIPTGELSLMRLLDPNVSDERPMANQSPYIVNLSLGYDNSKTGTAVTLLYNVFGRRFYYNADGGTPDIYEMPHKQLDFVLSQNIFRGATFKASCKNILNEGFETDYYYVGSGAKTPFQTHDGGRSFSIGMTYKVL
jgi:TonB-dependent receptor